MSWIFSPLPSGAGELLSVQVLTVADASHAHKTDAVTLVQVDVLTVADASHAHTTDEVTLTVPPIAATLTVADAIHRHTTDAVIVSLTYCETLTVPWRDIEFGVPEREGVLDVPERDTHFEVR